MPSQPNATYKDGGWQGWGHWLGTGRTRPTTKFLPFAEALAVAQSLGLASKVEWRAWCKEGMRPAGTPSQPDVTYKGGGWQGWGHWLGTGHGVGNTKSFLPFAEALTVARSFNLASSKEWTVWSKEGLRPPNVPANPRVTYKDDGWQGWGHWLGTGHTSNNTKKQPFLPFDECLRAARHLRLVSKKEWRLWCRSGARPANVPATPDKVYVHDGWFGWEHWLCHANLDPATALTMAPPGNKRAAPGCAGAASGRGRGKRRRR